MKSIYLIIFILIVNSAYGQLGSGAGQSEPTTLELIITSDMKDVTVGQPINISFILTNTGEATANGIEIYARFCDEIEKPIGKNLAIDNKKGIDPDGHGHSIFSLFDGKKDINDHATIDTNGDIKIEVGSLGEKSSILINFVSLITSNAIINTSNFICNPIDYNQFTWNNKKSWTKPKIDKLRTKKMEIFRDLDIIIDPLYNITDYDGRNYTIFEGTKLRFANNGQTFGIDNMTIWDDLIDDEEPPSQINDHYAIINTGHHKFWATIDLPSEIIYLNNVTVIRVIDIIQYYRDHVISRDVLIIMIGLIIIPLLLGMAGLWLRKKYMDKTCPSILFFIGSAFFSIIIYVIIYYLTSNTIYTYSFIVESIPILFAIVILSYYHCYNDSYVFRWEKIPGKDNERLIEFLTQISGIDWVKTANIKKIDNGKTIEISTEKKFPFIKT